MKKSCLWRWCYNTNKLLNAFLDLEYDVYALSKPSNFGTMIFIIYTYILLCYYLKVLAIDLLDLLTQTDNLQYYWTKKLKQKPFTLFPNSNEISKRYIGKVIIKR